MIVIVKIRHDMWKKNLPTALSYVYELQISFLRFQIKAIVLFEWCNHIDGLVNPKTASSWFIDRFLFRWVNVMSFN